MKFYLICCVFLLQTCFQCLNGNQVEKNENKNIKVVLQNKDVYEMRYICWIVIGINIIGGIMFLVFGRSSDSKEKNENESEKMVKITIKQLDSM